MSDKNFKVKNGLTIQGTIDTLITADDEGGILVGGSPVAGASAATLSTLGTVYGQTDSESPNNTFIGRYAFIGENAVNAVSVGGYAGGAGATSVGGSSGANGDVATAIGANAQAYLNATAIGFGTYADNDSIAIGKFANAAPNEIVLGNEEITRFKVPGLGIDWTASTVPGPSPTYSTSLPSGGNDGDVWYVYS